MKVKSTVKVLLVLQDMYLNLLKLHYFQTTGTLLGP
jgi:hypothetical protein